MSEMDVLFPIPQGGRNADDMGMPSPITPKAAMIPLTPADIEAIARVIAKHGSRIMYECDEDIFRAGMAAMADRYAPVIEAAKAMREALGPGPICRNEAADFDFAIAALDKEQKK